MATWNPFIAPVGRRRARGLRPGALALAAAFLIGLADDAYGALCPHHEPTAPEAQAVRGAGGDSRAHGHGHGHGHAGEHGLDHAGGPHAAGAHGSDGARRFVAGTAAADVEPAAVAGRAPARAHEGHEHGHAACTCMGDCQAAGVPALAEPAAGEAGAAAPGRRVAARPADVVAGPRSYPYFLPYATAPPLNG